MYRLCHLYLTLRLKKKNQKLHIKPLKHLWWPCWHILMLLWKEACVRLHLQDHCREVKWSKYPLRSLLVRFHLNSCAHFSSQEQNTLLKWSKSNWRPPKCLGAWNTWYLRRERARFFLLEEKAEGDLFSATQWVIIAKIEPCLSHTCSKRVRDSGHNWEQGKFQLDMKKKVLILFWGFFDVYI